ncbi:flagellar motility protein MotE (MotC chaperone) [Sphingomonas naasensis]|uniref:MotE family protein n=1 Tax=Sphingomonas naasensis TaxID=1344951 RepID=UPI001F103876|nr:hypothetical protein [Sphingomonas naasensis]NIJ20837.1 flagellar motility protein MotE (MotC chaperone) [Sphingomonas naasensis]
MARPSLLLLTAAASALAVVANASTIAADATQSSAPKTRLGSSIEQDLAQRDADAARRKRGLDLREQATKAAQARLEADLAARQKEAEAAATPGSTAGGAPEAADAQFDELARIYQAMKPKAAAVVFEQLDMEVQMKVAQRMRERSTAMIMAAMTPKGAAALSMALARKSARMAAVAPPAGARPQRPTAAR